MDRNEQSDCACVVIRHLRVHMQTHTSIAISVKGDFSLILGL